MSYPEYTFSDYESSFIRIAPRIKFHLYVLYSTCSICGLIGEGRLRCNLCEVEKTDGKLRSKTILTLKEFVIGNFTYEIYLPSLEK